MGEQSIGHRQAEDEVRKKSLAWRSIMGRAHFNPPPVTHTPLLVWRLGIWKPVAPADNRQQAIKNQYSRLRVADEFIANLFTQFAYDENITRIDAEFYVPDKNCLRLFAHTIENPFNSGWALSPIKDISVSGDGQQHMRTMCVTWFGIDATLQFEAHAEIVTFTTFLDLSSANETAARPLPVPETERSAQKNLNEIDKALDRLNKLLCAGVPQNREYTELFRKLFVTPRNTILHHLMRMENTTASLFGKVFVDFRGVVVSSPAGRTFSEKKPRFFLEPRWRTDDEISPLAAKPLPKTQWDMKLRALWPFLTAPPMKGMDTSKHEFSISRIMNGRALIATTLGFQPPEPMSDLDTLPLFYFIYTNGAGARQTGRLIDTLSHLGTFRLAALLGIDRMHEAAPLLGVSESLIRKTFDEMLSPDLRGRDDEERLEFSNLDEDEQELWLANERAQVLARYLPRIGDSLHDVTNVFSGGEDPDNFERRIELSRFYADKFRDGVRALRIGRMEGFLPYDKFVERRLGPAYGLIDLISARYQRIRADINILRQTEIAQRSRLAENESAEAEKSTNRLQASAELGFFLVLAPYYLGNLLIEKIFRVEEHAPVLWAVLWIALGFFFTTEPGRTTGRAIFNAIAFAPVRFEGLPNGQRWLLTVGAILSGALAIYLSRL